MGFSTCPRCGHQGLKNKRETRRTPNGEVHEMTVQRCGECGWKNV